MNDNRLTDSELVKAQLQYPSLKEMPEKAREILILRAVGYTQEFIAKRLGCTQPAISQAIKQYDPDGIYKPDMDLRREVIRTSLGNVALECVRHLSEKTDELADYTPSTLLSLLGKLETIQESLKTGMKSDEGIKEAMEGLAN